MSALLPLIVCLMAADQAPKLEAGIALYQKGDLGGSLSLLLEALDTGTAKQRATARLYVGLIQHRTGNTVDASSSFKHALELWPQIRPPKGTPRATIDAFERVREKVAPSDREPPPPTKQKQRRHTEQRNGGSGPEVLEPEDDTGTRRSDYSVDAPQPEDDVTATEPLPKPEEPGVPTFGWVAVGVGAASVIAGVTLAIVAGVTGKKALDDPDQANAESSYKTAGTENKAALGCFAAGGVLFGVAALSVTF